MREVPVCNFKHLNPGVWPDNFELEAETDLLPVLADAGRQGRIKYVIQNETLFTSHNGTGIDKVTGKFCDIPCDFISAPRSYSPVFSRFCTDEKELRSISPPFIENKRFLELQGMVSTYQGTGNPDSGQILNAFQLWFAEQNGCGYFLTVDYSLIEVIRKQNGRLLTEVVKPSELIKIIFNSENREVT